MSQKNKKNMERDNHQLYAMYMMLGSYFKKAGCLQRRLENKLAASYRRLKEADQVALEDTCIEFADQVLTAELPEELFSSEVTVLLKNDAKELGAAFVGAGFYLCVYAVGTASRYYLLYDFWKEGARVRKGGSLPGWLVKKLAEQKKREEKMAQKNAEKNTQKNAA